MSLPLRLCGKSIRWNAYTWECTCEREEDCMIKEYERRFAGCKNGICVFPNYSG